MLMYYDEGYKAEISNLNSVIDSYIYYSISKLSIRYFESPASSLESEQLKQISLVKRHFGIKIKR